MPNFFFPIMPESAETDERRTNERTRFCRLVRFFLQVDQARVYNEFQGSNTANGTACLRVARYCFSLAAYLLDPTARAHLSSRNSDLIRKRSPRATFPIYHLL